MEVYLSEHIAPSAYARLARHFEIVDNFDHPEQLAAMIIRRAAVPRSVPLSMKYSVRLYVVSTRIVRRCRIPSRSPVHLASSFVRSSPVRPFAVGACATAGAAVHSAASATMAASASVITPWCSCST